MSAVLHTSATAQLALHAPARWLRAWSKMDARHVTAWLLASITMMVVDFTALVDKLDKPGVTLMIAFDMFTALVCFGTALLAWMAATDGAADSGRSRNVRVAWAVAVGGIAAAVILVPLMQWADIDTLWWEMAGKSKPRPDLLLLMIGNSVNFAAYAALFVAAMETLHRRRLTSEAIRQAQREQAGLSRKVLESRLAAMQAQVEPQFLFDTLVDVERLYEKDARHAADNLDRLITYLRVALPRLRETGSSVAAEISLVDAYLNVARSLNDGAPTLTVTLEDGSGDARFYPMLLLPLVQRAMRAPAVPASIRIAVRRVTSDIVVVLRIAGYGCCAEDAESARVRERLTGLYGDRASLECRELTDGSTQFTLRVPAPPAAAARTPHDEQRAAAAEALP